MYVTGTVTLDCARATRGLFKLARPQCECDESESCNIIFGRRFILKDEHNRKSYKNGLKLLECDITLFFPIWDAYTHTRNNNIAIHRWSHEYRREHAYGYATQTRHHIRRDNIEICTYFISIQQRLHAVPS